MEIQGLYTPNGGKVHVHLGSRCTTNLWNTWLEITDVQVIHELRGATVTCDKMKVLSVRDKYANTIQNLSKPYTRAVKQGAPAPAPTYQNISTQPAQITNPFTQTITQSTNTATDNIPDTEQPVAATPAAGKTETPIDATKIIRAAQITAVENLQKFFSEFNFNPAARFINTAALQPTTASVKQYVTNYAKLINNSDSDSIAEKVKSPEFTQIASDLIAHPPVTQINKRLTVWYGDAGTGKTTKAIAENPTADVIPCNANIMPDELMRTFDFNDSNGNPVFKPSSLRIAMETGKTIIFDEINLLTFDCLRLLQTLTDSKDSITYNGDVIKIQPGFKIIGTMNLVVNDQVYNLPEPLVDRCAEIKEFKISAKDLAAYAFN